MACLDFLLIECILYLHFETLLTPGISIFSKKIIWLGLKSSREKSVKIFFSLNFCNCIDIYYLYATYSNLLEKKCLLCYTISIKKSYFLPTKEFSTKTSQFPLWLNISIKITLWLIAFELLMSKNVQYKQCEVNFIRKIQMSSKV